MFPSSSPQITPSEQDNINLEEQEETDRNSESVDEIASSDTQAPAIKVNDSPDEEITKPPDNIPNNQFGMMGLLSCIRAAKHNPNLLTLAMGMNLTELGLNLNTPETLHTTFSGPFASRLCRLQDVDYPVPIEYLVNKCVKERLPDLNLSKFKDDIIFFLFYGSIGDRMQMKSAAELYRRNWRYHIEERVWLCKIPGLTTYTKIGTVEQGTFYYFNPFIWRRVPRDFEFDCSKIEKCPSSIAII